MMRSKLLIGVLLTALAPGLPAQNAAGSSQGKTLTLEQCRQMAVQANKALRQAETRMEMAGYDRKIAQANYFPNISAKGTYHYTPGDFSFIGEEQSALLNSLGTHVQGQFDGFMQGLTTAIMSNPAAAAEYMGSPMWQTVLGALSQADVSTLLNHIGQEIDGALHPEIEHVFIGAVSLQQPLFMGGKIVNANRVARLAEELAHAQYDKEYQEVLAGVDEAYWQIVSVAGKKKLAEGYCDLLEQMLTDVQASVAAGVATESDALTIKVKANEAQMLRTKATGGLSLAKMLLCKQIGLPLDSDITLADESLDAIPAPGTPADKPLQAVLDDRPETRCLDLAAQIYDGKARMARADMLPKVALTANYLVSNPNMQHGFQREWGGRFNAGVLVSVPIFHGTEALQKTRKAKAEASLYRSRYDDACQMIELQLAQLRRQGEEAAERLQMAESNLESAEENLRAATVGFEAGVVDAHTALAAQTAWLQAHSEYLDAGVELQMNATLLRKAQGAYTQAQ